jgi:hypothetical protein
MNHSLLLHSSLQLHKKFRVPNVRPASFRASASAVGVQQGMNMTTVFDILKKDRRGTFLWLEAVDDIETAQTRLRQLSELSTDEFVVFCNVDLKVVATSRKD